MDPNDQNSQDIIAGYLERTDPAKNKSLKEILKKEGQKEAAVITADGFLINGNRRKWALQKLNEEFPDEKFKTMKVVILPGSENAERPTMIDIALLENKFQTYVTGKSEYSVMNKALTFYENVKSGISLKELLKEDPTYGNLNNKEFNRKVTKFENDHFKPLELMTDYLKINKVPGDFNRVADRWQSFHEMHAKILNPLSKDKTLVEYNLKKDDIGIIQAAAYNLIKVKDTKEVAHQNRDLIRSVLKWTKVDRKELYKIGKIEDVDDSIKDPDERNLEWQKKYSEKIINSIKKLNNLSDRKEEKEDPIDRLLEALQKLEHEDLEIPKLEKMSISDAKKALDHCNEIETVNKDLKSFFYNITKKNKKKLEELIKKFSSR